MPYFVYILKCADGSYYTGSASDLSRRLTEHQDGLGPGSYSFPRRPVELVWCEEVEARNEALQHEHQIKGWTRAKKEALIRNDFQRVHEIVKMERRGRERSRKRDPSP